MTERTPCDLVMKHLVKLSLENDKPIMLDYWKKSLTKDVVVGVRSSGEKLLVKNEELIVLWAAQLSTMAIRAVRLQACLRLNRMIASLASVSCG